jgi:putative cell wall-binding protein
MKDTTWGKTSEQADHPWTGRTINLLRFDPNEDRGARTWYLDGLRIAADDAAAPTFQITWHDASGSPGDRATVGLDTDRAGFDGEILAADIVQKAGTNRLLFDATDRLPATYWVHVTSRDQATGDTSGIYATGPMKVSPRIAGPGREQTAVELSRQRFGDGADVAVLADSRNFPDALAAGPLAAKLGAPILLTGPNVSSDVESELERLGVARILIVGGPNSVPDSVVAELSNRWTVRRIHGDGRDQTSVAVAQEIVKTTGAAGIIVASGATFPDALAAGPLAAVRGTAILLVDPTHGSEAVSSFIRSADPKALTVVGGENSVPDDVANSVAQGREWTRLWGTGRFETAAAVFDAAAAAGADTRHVLVASGEGFPDALAAGAAIARSGGVLVLTGKHGVPSPTQRVLSDGNGTHRSWRVVGGHNTVTHATIRSLLATSGLG